MSEKIIKNLESRIDRLEKRMTSSELLITEGLHYIFATLSLFVLKNRLIMKCFNVQSNSIKILQSLANYMVEFNKDGFYKSIKDINIDLEKVNVIINEFDEREEKYRRYIQNLYKRILQNPKFDDEFKNSVRSLYFEVREEKNK